MDFADDIVTFDSNKTNAGEHLKNIQETAAKVGLKINRDKTKMLLVNHEHSDQPPKALDKLEIVDDFKYLGAKIQSVTKIMGKTAIRTISFFYPLPLLTMLRNNEQNLRQAMSLGRNIV